MSVTKQDKFPLFSAEIGDRVAWLRERQGVTLEVLGAGKPTTAQSWEEGKTPRKDKWRGIAERMRLSEFLIFHGRPESAEDYAFIAKHAWEIEGVDPHLKKGGLASRVEEPQAPYSAGVASRIPLKREPSTREDCEAYMQRLFDAAQLSENPNAFPALHDRLQKKFPLDEWEEAKPQ